MGIGWLRRMAGPLLCGALALLCLHYALGHLLWLWGMFDPPRPALSPFWAALALWLAAAALRVAGVSAPWLRDVLAQLGHLLCVCALGGGLAWAGAHAALGPLPPAAAGALGVVVLVELARLRRSASGLNRLL